MKKKYILSLLCSLMFIGLSAQTIEDARSLLNQHNYVDAKPIFLKYLKTQPNNGNYNLWYGISCLKTGDIQEAVKYLEIAVKRRAQGGQYYLGQAYNDAYLFEQAIECYENYITDLSKKKQSTEEAEKLLEKSKANFRMLKGVEDVCIIDSVVVDKDNFLSAYKISEESGRLYTYNQFFKKDGDHQGTVYENEIGNKIYFSEANKNDDLNLYSKFKLQNEWSAGHLLPDNINVSGNTNYPFALSDGITIYYATDGEGLGGYDIFVTRYNTNNDTYLLPENVGMPFNSPYNDYMYVIDEYNNLGWFASDRRQPEGKVCIYIFIPNATKQTYNYESMDPNEIIRLAQIQSLKDTWKDKKTVDDALKRLKAVVSQKPTVKQVIDFEFIIDDNSTYYTLNNFKSAKAKQLFQQYQLKEKDFNQQIDKLNLLRQQYADADSSAKKQLTPAILDLEKRVLQMQSELDILGMNVRSAEKTTSK